MTDAHVQAVTDFSRNLVVLAGAGTGKTSLLVERLLVALGSGAVRLDEVAAITFTEKAAGELRQRVALGLERLHDLAIGAVDLDEGREADRALVHLRDTFRVPPASISRRALDAHEAIGGAAIETIHALCARLLRSWPRQAGVPSSFVVDPGPQTAAVLSETWDGWLLRELGEGRVPRPVWARMLSRVPLPDVRAIAEQLAASALSDDFFRGSLPPSDAAGLCGAAVDRQATTLADAAGSTMRRDRRERFEQASRAVQAFRSGGLDGLRAALGSDPELARGIQSIADADRTNEVEVIVREAARIVRSLAEADATLAPDLLELLAPYVEEAREALLTRGLIGYDALLERTRTLLASHPAVRTAVKARLRMILVDEVQDTDPLQYEIVLLLGERRDRCATAAWQTDPEPGRLFLVGDPKQSIYRFRGADYPAFDRMVRHLEQAGASVLPLTTNYRSTVDVLRPIHRLFEPATSRVWSPSFYQPAYVPVTANRGQAGSAPAVELWTVDLEPGSRAAERREAEGQVLAREVRAAVERGEFRYKDVLILLRAFSVALRPTLRALRAEGVPFVVQGGREFLERPETSHLLAVLRAIAEPDDAAALVAFLRSPAGGVPDTELAAWVAQGGAWTREQRPPAHRFPELARALTTLRALVDGTRDLPASSVVRAALRATSLVELNACAFEGAQRVANLRKLAALTADLARDGRLTLLELVEELETPGGADMEAESPLADERMEAVRVLTVHGAKGLEGRVVFVPDLAREEPLASGPRRARAHPVRLNSGAQSLAIELPGRCNHEAIWRSAEEKQHTRAEEARVLYVALTRARERLIVICGPNRRYARWIDALAPWGYDQSRPPADGAILADGDVVHRTFRAGRPVTPPVETVTWPEAEAARAWQRVTAALRASASPRLQVPSRLAEEREAADWSENAVALRRRRLGSPHARAVGTVVHGCLERWDPARPEQILLSVESATEAAAAEHRVDPEPVQREARGLLGSFLSSPLAERLAGGSTVARELPVLLADGDTTWQGSIDLLYRDAASGELVIADYKTDHDANEEELRARYRPQLDVYRRAVQTAMGLPTPPRAELWLVRTGRIVTV